MNSSERLATPPAPLLAERPTALARSRRAGDLVPWAGALVGAATITYGLRHSSRLGTARAPFFVGWDPRLGWSIVAVTGLFMAGLLIASSLRSPRVAPPAFAAGALALGLVLRLGLNATRGVPHGWWPQFGDPQTDYLPALSALHLGVRGFLDRFAELGPSLPVHPSGHPPGLLLLLHSLGISGPTGFGVLAIVAGALAVPLTYVLGRQLLDEERARLATLFVIFSPATLLFGAASADALFATLALLPAIALLGRRPAIRLAGPPLVALASFFSYPLPATAVWAALVIARTRLRSAVALGAACLLALAAFYLALYALTGFDLLGSLSSAGEAYRRGIASVRPFAFWALGSPTAWMVALGLPLAWLVLRGAGRGETTALALVAVVVTCAALGFTKAETERIWLFLVPPACVAAAAAARRGRANGVLCALAVQAVAVQALLNTHF